MGLDNNESNSKKEDKDKDKAKNHLDLYLKQTTSSILGKIKTIKSSNKKNKESFSQVDGDSGGDSANKRELGFSVVEGLKETGGSINDTNREYSQMNEGDIGTLSVPLDSKQSINKNIDLNEIDKNTERHS